MTDKLASLGREVERLSDDEFLKVRETLTRVGVASGKTLTQSCHVLHKKGRYFIVHFKEMFSLDGKETTLSDDDVARRDVTACLLRDWNLVKLVAPLERPTARVTVIPFKDKSDWTLVAKYAIGQHRVVEEHAAS